MVSSSGPVPRAEDPWFAIRRGQRIGPFTSAGLEEQLRSGALHDRSFVWRPTMAAWTRMNQVEALAAMLASFRAWAESQQERTVVQPMPERPAGAPSPGSVEAPPVPADASAPSAEVARSEPSRHILPPPGGDLVDALYSGISQPALDLRKAAEVQPEEPPLPAHPSWHEAPVARPRPAAGEPAPVSADLSPASIALGEGDHGFFGRTVVAPEAHWPHGPASDALLFPDVTRAPDAEIHLEAPGRPAPQHPSTNLQEFSLLIRLGQRSRRNVFIALGAIGGTVVVTIGVLVGLSVGGEPEAPVAEKAEEPAMTAEMSYQKRAEPTWRTEYAAAPPLETWIQKPQAARPARPDGVPAAGAPGSNGTSALTKGAAEPQLEKLGKIDAGARTEFQRYAGLLSNDAQKPAEATVDVKPKTITEMPKSTLTKSGMDAFMNTKMRRFSECKGRMTRPTDMPVKVGLSFSISAEGRVGDIVVDQSGSRDDGLDGCIRRIVAGWAFPPPDEPSTFKTTLLL
jgi:hypothetical protein